MELTIKITKENKEKIFTLISAILEDERPTSIQSNKSSSKINYLATPEHLDNLPPGSVAHYGTNEDDRLKLVGTWGQFNSFFPVKAALRILGNMIAYTSNRFIRLDNFIDQCIDVISKTKISGKRLGGFRGFPSRSKDSAIGRFVWHFLTPTFEMGLITIQSEEHVIAMIPHSQNDWSKVAVSLTQEGYYFASLQNPVFDNMSKNQILSQEEKKWLINYLIKINQDGFNEYSILFGVYSTLLQSNNDPVKLWNWFENNTDFINYIKSWTTKINDENALNQQILNLSRTFASSKIALLRELGIVRDKRGDYSIIGDLIEK